MDLWASITSSILLIFLIFLSAFFSAAETAYTSVQFSKIETDFVKGKKAAKLIKKHYKTFGWTLSTILLSNNIVNIGASSLTTYLFSMTLGATPTATIISIFAITPIIVVCGEIIPKIFAKKYSYGYLKKVAYLIEWLNYLFWPITFPLSKISIQSKITNSEKELSNLIKIARSEGVLDRNEATLVSRALEIDDKFVREAMIKKSNIVWINLDVSISQAKAVFASSGLSRLIVKKGEEFIGVLLLKDIIFMKDADSIKEKIKPIIGISKSRKLSKALEKLRINRVHIALVVKSKGSRDVVGIITLEDIIEELIGEIYDEHDEKLKVTEIAHHKYIAEGSTEMSDIIQLLNFEFENADNLTLKQWVQSRINRTIKKNLKYEYKEKFIFKIITNRNKRETLIEITKK